MHFNLEELRSEIENLGLSENFDICNYFVFLTFFTLKEV